MKKIKPHQKVLYYYAIRIFKGTLAAGEKLPPLEQISARLGVDPAALKIGLRQLKAMNLLQINQDGEIYVKDYHRHARFEFLGTLFECLALWPEKNIIDQQLINEIWHFWSIFMVDIIRLAAQKATMKDIKPIVDTFDQELSSIHAPEKLVELELILCDHLVKMADNLMITILYNSTRQIIQKLIAMFFHAITPETIERYTAARKQMVSVFAAGLSTELHSTIENFQELVNSIWQEHYHLDQDA